MKKLYLLICLSVLIVSCGVDSLLQEAEIKKVAGKTSDAIELYTRAIKQDQSSIEAYKGRAAIYSGLKMYDKAFLDYLRAAIEAEHNDSYKDDAGLFYNQAAVYQEMHNLSQENDDLCFIADKYYKKSCDLGYASACDSKCLKK